MTPETAQLFGAAIAMLSTAGVGLGLGNIVASWLSAISRNPGADAQYRSVGLLGLAFTEAIALFALVVALIILFK